MKIEIGKTYTFAKSGNEVRVIEPANLKYQASSQHWIVERVDGKSRGKRMIVSEAALAKIA